jgi:hypothetical protein
VPRCLSVLMMCVLVSIVAGCSVRDWKSMQQPVRVGIFPGDDNGEQVGDFRVSDDGSFATLETDCQVKVGEVITEDRHLYVVVSVGGAREFQFSYVLARVGN